tara:strand:- start:236 stop:466 length:231 start_codon:yes stop_codon:yes gene_type:complete
MEYIERGNKMSYWRYKKEVKKSENDGEYYVVWQEDLDCIILYEEELVWMLNKIRKFKLKEKKKARKKEKRDAKQRI